MDYDDIDENNEYLYAPSFSSSLTESSSSSSEGLDLADSDNEFVSDSDSDDFEDYMRYIINSDQIKPYQFEPTISDGKSNCKQVKKKNSESEEHYKDRLNNLNWCLCDQCDIKPTGAKCLCCRECQSIDEKLIAQNNHYMCITQLPFFHDKLCDDEILCIMISMFQKFHHHLPSYISLNKKKRYLAYRCFTSWIYKKLGKGVPKTIPSCVVKAIQARFPKIEDKVEVKSKIENNLEGKPEINDNIKGEIKVDLEVEMKTEPIKEIKSEVSNVSYGL